MTEAPAGSDLATGDDRISVAEKGGRGFLTRGFEFIPL